MTESGEKQERLGDLGASRHAADIDLARKHKVPHEGPWLCSVHSGVDGFFNTLGLDLAPVAPSDRPFAGMKEISTAAAQPRESERSFNSGSAPANCRLS